MADVTVTPSSVRFRGPGGGSGSVKDVTSTSGTVAVPPGTSGVVYLLTGASTVTLPDPESGLTITIKNMHTASITINGNIEGDTSESIYPQEVFDLLGTSTTWRLI